MAGIWDRIKHDATDRLAVHELESAIVHYVRSGLTLARLRDDLNLTLQSPLTAADEADLQAMAAHVDGVSGLANKLGYLEDVKAWTIWASRNLTTEAEFRTHLGL